MTPPPPPPLPSPTGVDKQGKQCNHCTNWIAFCGFADFLQWCGHRQPVLEVLNASITECIKY